MTVQFTKRKDDCLTCAFVNATGLAYDVVYESFKLMGINLNQQYDKMFNMKRISILKALFTKKPLVIVYSVSESSAHAIASNHGRCIDNQKDSALNNRSVMHIFLNKKILAVWSK